MGSLSAKAKISLVLSVVVVLVASVYAFFALYEGQAAGPYHVRTDGSDAICNGLADQPASAGNPCAFQTPQKGLDTAQSGETVLMHGGTYTAAGAPVLSETPILGINGKNPASAITVRDFGDGEVIFDGQLTRATGILIYQSSNIVIEGITLQNFTGEPTSGSWTSQPGTGVAIREGTSNITLRRLKIQNSKLHLDGAGCPNCSEISLWSFPITNITLEDSEIQVRQPLGFAARADNTSDPANIRDQFNVIRRNYFYSTDDNHRYFAIFGRHAGEYIVERNYFIDAAANKVINGIGETLGIAPRDSHRWTIRNNVLEEFSTGIFLWDQETNSDGENVNETHLVYNNTIVGTASATDEDNGVAILSAQNSSAWNNITRNVKFGFRLENSSVADLSNTVLGYNLFNNFDSRNYLAAGTYPGSGYTLLGGDVVHAPPPSASYEGFVLSGAKPSPYYELSSSASPAVDSGHPSFACGSTVVGTRCDIGAYEFGVGVPGAPIVTLSPSTDQIINVSSIDLSGSATDDVQVVSFDWGTISGCAKAVIVLPSLPGADVSRTDRFTCADGTYAPTLTAVDNDSNSTQRNINLTVDTTAPSVPTGVSANINVFGRPFVQWSASSDGTGSGMKEYVVRRATTAGGPYTDITVPLSPTLYTDMVAQPNTTYFYRVRARDVAGNVSGDSAEVSVTTPLFVSLQDGALLPGGTTYAGTRDNPVLASQVTTNGGALGEWYVGTNAAGTGDARLLLLFDLTEAASEIPAGAVVQSAQLSLFLWSKSTTLDNVIAAYPLLRGWGEGTKAPGTATAGESSWQSFDFNCGGCPNNGDWTQGGAESAGNDRGGTSIGSRTISTADSVLTFKTWSLDVATVQSWIDNPSSNLGMILIGREDNTGSNQQPRFRLSEHTTAGERPRLTVVYSLSADTTPPTVAVTAPADDATVSGGVTVAADASDASGIAGVEFQIDGASKLVDTTAPYSYDWDTTPETNASHIITVIATDASVNGNQSQTSISVNVSNVVPAACGNSIIDPGEQCDDVNLGGASCSSLGYAGGTLGCHPQGSPDECRFDIGACVAPASPPPSIAAEMGVSLNDAGGSGSYERGTRLATIPDSLGFCPPNMVWVPAPGNFCIDKYEAAGATYVSAPGVLPERAISRVAASNACENRSLVAGKMSSLPTAYEWWLGALGTPDPDPAVGAICNVTGSAVEVTDSRAECRSHSGARDTVGNVAEWTADSVNCDGSGCLFAGFRYTISGFVNALTSQGVPIPPFAGSGVGAFGKDYVALPPTLSGSYAVVRGGDSSGGERAGVHSVNLAITESDSGANVGFRCVIR